MKKLLLSITMILTLLLAGCNSDGNVSNKSSKDDDDNVSSSSKSNYKNDDDDDTDSGNIDSDNADKGNGFKNRGDDKGPNSDNPDNSTLRPVEVVETIDEGNDDSEDLLPGEVKLPNSLTLEIPEIGSFKIKTYTISEYYNEKIITLKGDYTNLRPESDLSLSNMRSHFHAYQDSVMLNAEFPGTDIDLFTMVRPGKTIEASCTYVLRTETDAIELIGTDFHNVDYTVTFPIN